MKSVVVKYGVIGGVIVSLLFLGPMALRPDSYMNPENMGIGQVVGYSIMILSMLCVFFGVRAYRKHHIEFEFSFVQGLLVGLQITVVANVIFYLGNVLLYEVIAPDFLHDFGKFYKSHMISNAPDEATKKLVAAEFDAQAGILENSYLYALVMAASTFFIGIIISLISALSLKRTKKSA